MSALSKCHSILRHGIRSIEIAGTAMALVAMVVLALRSALRLELRWDTFAYHLPIAAIYAHLGIPYQMEAIPQGYYQGFPPLPEFLQGVLWRITGSVNATGVLNYLALCLFLFFVWRFLGARLWLTVILCLTVPLVLIHAASSYVDLFSNALLAISVTALLGILLFERWTDRKLLYWALAGATAAAWSKFTMLPILVLVFIVLLAVFGVRARRDNPRTLLLILCALLIAMVPCLKNLVKYHNPIWPDGVTVLGHPLPSLVQSTELRDVSAPPMLRNASQPELFYRSLFEIGHPVSYPNRERWIIDQGSTFGIYSIAFRSGGFWAVSVITMTCAAILLAFLSSLRHGVIVAGTVATLWSVLSIIPQSHELRYFQFLPLTMAALIAILLPRQMRVYPATTFVLLCILLGEFVWVSKINRTYYRVEKVGLRQAADEYGVTQYWSRLQPGKTYCAVGFAPASFLLTGPTLHEYHIIGREDAGQCPQHVSILTR